MTGTELGNQSNGLLYTFRLGDCCHAMIDICKSSRRYLFGRKHLTDPAPLRRANYGPVHPVLSGRSSSANSRAGDLTAAPPTMPTGRGGLGAGDFCLAPSPVRFTKDTSACAGWQIGLSTLARWSRDPARQLALQAMPIVRVSVAYRRRNPSSSRAVGWTRFNRLFMHADGQKRSHRRPRLSLPPGELLLCR